jgi:hypothetical protein
MWTDEDRQSSKTWAKAFTADPTGYLYVDPSTGFLKQGNYGEWGFTQAAIERITGQGIDTEWEITIEMRWDNMQVRYGKDSQYYRHRGLVRFEMGFDCDTRKSYVNGYHDPNAGYARYTKSFHINSNHMTTPMYCPVFQGGDMNQFHNKGEKWYQVLHPTVAVPTQYDTSRSPPNKDPVTGKDSHLICIKDGNGGIPESYGNLMCDPGVTHKIVIKRRANKGIQVDIVHAASGKSMLYGGIFLKTKLLKPDNFDFKPGALPFCFFNGNHETTFMSVQSTG